MNRINLVLCGAVALLFMGAARPAAAQTRTPWLMNDGAGVTNPNSAAQNLVRLQCVPARNGDSCEYSVASIPDTSNPGWRAAPDGSIINFHHNPSLVCQAPPGQTCEVWADFTYFETFVNIPANVQVTTFTIAFNDMDDGSRVTIFNSANPNGFVVPGSYVFLGGSGTTNLHSLVVSGEVNRVVVSQVDDCCSQNNLGSAVVVLNGQIVHTGCNTAADCSDNDQCTVDSCNPDGSCSHESITCNDLNACTVDACSPTAGCVFSPINCDDGSACTNDSCDAFLGCQHATVNCNDNNACTDDSCSPSAGCINSVHSCDDSNACTTDSCNVVSGCQTAPVNCNDSNACTVDSCNPASGCFTTPVNCNDSNACTNDSCNPNSGCQYAAVNCNDNNLCTIDSCFPATGCAYAAVNCDDGVHCTKDYCVPATGCHNDNQCPDCSAAASTVGQIWPPNHKYVAVGVKGITNPQGQNTTIHVDGVAQDEVTNGLGDGDTCPDAEGVGTTTAQVRAERSGLGDGRVYHVFFTATDPDGFSCSGAVSTCVPHDQGKGNACVDQGPKYDSLTCQ